MTYGTKQLENGKRTGSLTFSTGKRIYLSAKERADFDEKIAYWQACAVEKHEENKTK